MRLKTIYACMAVAALTLGSCITDKWEEEQYAQFVSFKAPTSNSTVTQIRLKYRADSTHYRLPLIVSGTMNNGKDLDVHVGVDRDTLLIYNMQHFGEGRKDLWYKELSPSRYVFNPVTRIPAGENTALVDIQFDFHGLDFSEKWMLPLIVEDDPSYNYQSHPKMGFNNALLWLTPFNDYSGSYSSTALSVYANGDPSNIGVTSREAFVVDENSVFFYMGNVEDNRVDRKYFKLKATFHRDDSFVPTEGSNDVEAGTVTLEPMNPIAGMDFTQTGEPTYRVTETMDSERPTLMRRVTTISGINYTFNDPTRVEGVPISYRVTGLMSLQRNINTAIPDEEFSIEW